MNTETVKTQNLTQYREEARKILSGMPWPDKKNEIWRRTPLSRLMPETFKGYEKNGITLSPQELPLPENQGGLIVFDGPNLQTMAVDPEQQGNPKVSFQESELFLTPREEEAFYPSDWIDRFSTWGDSETTHFLSLDFPANSTMAHPFYIRLNSLSRDQYTLPRLFLRFGTGWSGHVVILYCGDAKEQDREMVNAVLRGFMAENSHVKITEIQTLGEDSRLIQNSRFTQEADSSFHYTQLQLGAGTVKGNGNFHLNGKGADLQIHGMGIAGKGQHNDIRLVQQHNAPQTDSRANFKAFVKNRGRSVFQGLIQVEQEAPGTDAYLSNMNLILSDGARADAIPSLKILTDDVKCSHGSTTGKLDKNQIFYLTSRGFSLEEARNILTEGQMGDILEALPEDLRDWAKEQAFSYLDRG